MLSVLYAVFNRLLMHAWMLFVNSAMRLYLRKGPPRSGLLPATADIRPAFSIQVPSSHYPKRSITVNIFYPPGTRSEVTTNLKLPVHLNIHGCGFCYNNFTVDSELAAFIAQKAGCIVLDTDYAKAPAHPFPAAFDDICDVVAYILGHPDDWDLTRFTIGGASSGGCLALAVAATQPKGTMKGVLTFYPSTDLSVRPSESQFVPELPKGNPGLGFRPWERRLRRLAFVPVGLDLTDPRLSPAYAPPECFPPVTIICGDRDSLMPDIQRFTSKLHAAGNDIELKIVEGVGHGWERTVKPEQTHWVKVREGALEFFIDRLKQSWANV